MFFRKIIDFAMKHHVNFSKFTFVGIIASVLNIFFVWLLIDILLVKTIIATSAVVGSIFFLKFYMYLKIGLIKKQFAKYTFIQVLSAISNIFFTWLFIDVFFIPTIFATIMVVAGLFLARFVLFNLTNLIK